MTCRRGPISALRSRGLTLLEVVLSLGVVGTLLVAVVNTVGGALRTGSILNDQAQARLLAQDLMEEILQQHYEEPFEVPKFGPELSESGPDRSAFDDADDYHGWNAGPLPVTPRDKTGRVYPGLDGWARIVTVDYADPDDLLADGSTTDGVKRISVRITRDGRELSNLTTVLTESWIPPPYQ